MKKFNILAVAATALLVFASCAAPEAAAPVGTPAPISTPAPAAEPRLLVDREGDQISVPANVSRIVSLGPSNTEVFIALGLADNLVAIDTYSADTAGLPSGLPEFDMMQPNAEKIIELRPDLVCVTGMSKAYGLDQFKPLVDVGICVTFVPSPNSIEDIKKDVLFLGEVAGEGSKAIELVDEMTATVERYRELGTKVTDKKSVYFELSAAPAMYSFGRGVFLNEMIEIIGGVNIFAGQESWLSVSEESVISANPEFIFTNVEYIDNAVDEIKSRNGWDAIAAVNKNQVYKVSTDPSSLPNHNIVIAMDEMAKAMYPDIYGE